MHHFEDGGCIGRFPLATNENAPNKQTGEKVTNTEWHNIVVRNKAAEICNKYLKGDKVYLEGKLKLENGKVRTVNKIYQSHINEFNFLNNRTEISNDKLDAPNAEVPKSTDNASQTDDLPF